MGGRGNAMTPAQWARVLGAGERAARLAGQAVQVASALRAMELEARQIAAEEEERQP